MISYNFFTLFNYSGLSGSQFLSSIEQFDKSSASWNVPLQRDWRIINHSLNSPRYEMALASIPATKISVITQNFNLIFIIVRLPGCNKYMNDKYWYISIKLRHIIFILYREGIILCNKL